MVFPLLAVRQKIFATSNKTTLDVHAYETVKKTWFFQGTATLCVLWRSELSSPETKENSAWIVAVFSLRVFLYR